jgi:periplasmic protein CpxP/Spy
MTDNNDPAATPAGTPVAGGPVTAAANSSGPPAADGGRRCGPRGRRRMFAVGAAMLIGLVGFGIGRASSRSSHGFGPGMHRAFDADTASQRAERGIGYMLGRVDATPEQKAKITEIARTAIKDMIPAQQAHAAARDKVIAALKADKVDRAVIEQVRGEQLALGEALSKKATQAMADAADVLSPGQRAKLVDSWQSHGPRGWFRRG